MEAFLQTFVYPFMLILKRFLQFQSSGPRPVFIARSVLLNGESAPQPRAGVSAALLDVAVPFAWQYQTELIWLASFF